MNEIQFAYGVTGQTVDVIVRDKNAQVYNTSESYFEEYDSGNWGSYVITLTEQGSSGVYVADFPTNIAAGNYTLVGYVRTDPGNPYETDTMIPGGGSYDWPGTVPALGISALIDRDFRPTDLGGCVLWARQGIGVLNSSSLPPTDGGSITTWLDQSGTGNNLSQSASTNRPQWDSQTGAIQLAAGSLHAFSFPSGFSFNKRNASFYIVCESISTRRGGAGSLSDYAFFMSSSGINVYHERDGAIKVYDVSAGSAMSSALLTPSHRSLVGFAFGSSNARVRVNDQTASLTAITAGTSNGVTLSYAPNPKQMALIEVIVFNRQLSVTEESRLLEYAHTRGVPEKISSNVVVDGDSITWASVATVNRGWVRQLNLGKSVGLQNRAEASATLATLTSEGASYIDSQLRPGAKNVCIIFAGTNDIYLLGTTGANTYTLLQSYCSARKAAGWNRVIVLTMLPRGGSQEVHRSVYNAAIRTGFNNGTLNCDAIVDLAKDPRIGLAGCQSNTTMYPDNVHPSTIGCSIIADLVEKQLREVLAGTAIEKKMPTMFSVPI